MAIGSVVSGQRRGAGDERGPLMKRRARRAIRGLIEEALAAVPTSDAESSGLVGLMAAIEDADPDFVAGILTELGERAAEDDPELAVRLYQEAIGLGRHSSELSYNLGNALLRLGRERRAIASYADAIELDPQASLAYCNRGLARLRSDDRDGLDDLLQAARLECDFEPLYGSIARHLDDQIGIERAPEVVLDPQFSLPAQRRMQEGLQDHLAAIHYQFTDVTLFSDADALRNSCALGAIWRSDGAEHELPRRLALLADLRESLDMVTPNTTNWLVDHVEGLLAYAPICCSHMTPGLPLDVPDVCASLVDTDHAPLHDWIDRRAPDLSPARTDRRLAEFAIRCFRAAATSLCDGHLDVTRSDDERATTWNACEDLFREWARCASYLDQPTDVREAIEHARLAYAVLWWRDLVTDPRQIRAHFVLPMGDIEPAGGALFLDYFITEIVEDRLLCVASGPHEEEQFESAVATKSDAAARGPLDAFLEVNALWLPPKRRVERLGAAMADLDDPNNAARARAYLMTMHHEDLPSEVHPDLDEILLGPVRHRLPTTERLLVMPFNYLHNFPFHALPSVRAALDGGALQEVVYVPSVRMALPVEPPGASTSYGRCVFVGYTEYDDLPLEAERSIVQSRFEDTTVLVGRDATVTNVLAALGQCEVLHVCAHATADQERRQVGIRLHDGDLGVREILSMATVLPRLIVANTCISGVSMRESPNGDQPLSLPTAALIRGTQSVVGTLWKVRDDVAVRFAQAFYHALDAGGATPPGRAVAEAQRVLRDANPELALWAAHATFGAGRS